VLEKSKVRHQRSVLSSIYWLNSVYIGFRFSRDYSKDENTLLVQDSRHVCCNNDCEVRKMLAALITSEFIFLVIGHIWQ